MFSLTSGMSPPRPPLPPFSYPNPCITLQLPSLCGSRKLTAQTLLRCLQLGHFVDNSKSSSNPALDFESSREARRLLNFRTRLSIAVDFSFCDIVVYMRPAATKSYTWLSVASNLAHTTSFKRPKGLRLLNVMHLDKATKSLSEYVYISDLRLGATMLSRIIFKRRKQLMRVSRRISTKGTYEYDQRVPAMPSQITVPPGPSK